MRNVTITVSEEADITYNKPLQAAIGYLSMWACLTEKYKYVKIAVRRDGDVVARYYKDEACQDITYDILAKFGEDGSYSYHS
jgi:hypothetical protein